MYFSVLFLEHPHPPTVKIMNQQGNKYTRNNNIKIPKRGLELQTSMLKLDVSYLQSKISRMKFFH